MSLFFTSYQILPSSVCIPCLLGHISFVLLFKQKQKQTSKQKTKKQQHQVVFDVLSYLLIGMLLIYVCRRLVISRSKVIDSYSYCLLSQQMCLSHFSRNAQTSNSFKNYSFHLFNKIFKTFNSYIRVRKYFRH